jgi:hypothetical protein
VIGTRHPRLIVPAAALVLGSAIAAGAGIGAGWGAAFGVEAVAIAGAIFYYFVGAKDTDTGALFGGRPDERQASISMRSTALAGNALILTALGGVIVTSALSKTSWPFLLFCVVGAATYLMGLRIYRDH